MPRFWECIAAVLFILISYTHEAKAQQKVPVCTLNVRVSPERHLIEGTARLEIPEGMQANISVNALFIKKLLIDGRRQKPAAGIIAIKADAKTKRTAEIEYSAEFAEDALGNSPDPMTTSAQNVIAESGVMLLHGWYPEVQGLCIYKLTAGIPEYFDAVSESESTVTTVRNGLKNVSFDFSHPLLGLSLVAGRYVTNSYNHHGVMIKTYLFAEDRELAENYLAHTRQYLELYEALLGPFPYKSFAIVENNYQTGYSFPTYTLLGSQVIRLPFIVKTSLGHEILHQWFGNYVYVDSGKGNWAEGLTTYLADQWYSDLKGQGAEYRKKLLIDYMNYVTPENEITLSSFKSPDSYAARAVGYGKAAMVFHMLRKKLGDEIFFKSLKKFVETFRFREATWDDMRNSFMAESGQDLKDLFKQWISRKGAPALAIAHSRTAFREGKFLLSFDVFQDGEPFSLTIPVRVMTDSGDERFSIDISEAMTHCARAFTGRPLKIILDENYDAMRKLSEPEKPPVLSAFFGDKQAMVIVPERDEKRYRDAARYFKAQGFRVKKESEVTFEEIKTRSVLIFSDQNSFYRKLFAGESLPDGGCVVKAYENPLNNGGVVLVLTGKDAEEVNPVYRKLVRYGNYSLLIFDKGKIREEERADSEQGMVEDLTIAVAGVNTRDTLDLNAIVRDIKDKKVIYIGESHTAYADHVMQLEIIRRLYALRGHLIIGMEMFQRPFQKYLDQYVAKQLSEEEFLKKTEYFTRWGYDYNLYRDILNFARAHDIPVIALNLSREITEKVVEKGMDSLSAKERAELPADMNLNDQDYREYLMGVYLQHEDIQKKGFENFFVSQILWDETMAHSVADALRKYPEAQMVILAGIGHLQHSWGIPARVQRLTHDTSALILNDSGQGIERGLADFILFPKPVPAPESPKLQVMLKKEKEGVIIEKVMKNGPAEKAGLKDKDIIKKVDNRAVSDIDDIKILLLMKNRGDTVNVTVLRKKEKGKMEELILKARL